MKLDPNTPIHYYIKIIIQNMNNLIISINIDFFEQLQQNVGNKMINLILKLLTYVTLVLFFCPTSKSRYPNTDEYFDRIYVIHNGQSKHYLRLYCKEKNMISLSITKQLEFQEYPRFPIHSPDLQAPRMQRKIYTFWESCDVGVKVDQQGSIVKLVRTGTEEIIFAINDYTWRDEGDIQILTEDYSTKWGMGQRFQSHFAIKDGTWTVWNRDRPWEIDRGFNGKSAQTYGHQPVYLARSTYSPNFHLVYFKNTYGFNIDVSEMSKKIKYSVVGGHLHFVIIVGKHPEAILRQYHNYIGPASVPPFWSMGYHQSRWGYRNYDQFSKVVKQFEKHSLPLDTMWSDLDYMNNKAIFTVDHQKYPPAKMRDLMETKRIHYIPLIDAGISIADRVAMQEGSQSQIFLKAYRNSKQPYLGSVWPGKVHFVDYLHPNASSYWHSQLQRLHQLIPFSGVWLDMNEPSNFEGNQPTVQYYRIQHHESINMMTINVNLNHHCQTCNDLKHKQVHAYFGHLTTVPTYEFLKKKNGRPFIISRSNSVGTGVYAGHWTGDNVATWQFLRLSISGNFLFQIFGIQMVGADICGFHQNTNEELCSRWMQVGSFYPFARNHNQNESIPQEPYRFGNKLLETTKLSFYQRYSLLKQMYSTLLDLNGTGSFYRPLFFEFPLDTQSYLEKFVQTQFLIGDYLLGAPIVEQEVHEREVYFPKSETKQLWYRLQLNKDKGVTINSGFKFYKSQTMEIVQNYLPSPPPIFLRSGKLVIVNGPRTRVADLDNKYSLIAAISEENPRATGIFLAAKNFTDNSQIDQCVEKGCSLEIIVSRSVENSYILDWRYKGKANLEIDIQISDIRVVERQTLHKFSTKIHITTKEGRQTLQPQ